MPDYLNFIPTDPEYVPDEAAMLKTWQLLRLFAPDATVKIVVYNSITHVFTAPEENIDCPACQTLLVNRYWNEMGVEEPETNEWYNQAMEQARKSHFRDLMVATPCCGTRVSLNDLNSYEGFARFKLEVTDCFDIRGERFLQLERTLGCKLREVLLHF